MWLAVVVGLGGGFWRGTRGFGVEPLSDGTKGKSRQEGQPFFSQLDAIAPSTQNPRFWVLVALFSVAK